ncbi:radiation insensitive 1 [Rhodnius prolixus]|uniref:radiation insensitive 1 n=1 Tax=Rhodnius prolixus TaxID=13249 RepID=UPI003D188F53
MFPEENVEQCVLRGKINNIKNLSQLLKCIHFKEIAAVFASANGMKFVVEDSKCLQAAAFIGEDIFEEYQIKDELVSFRLELKLLMECLNIMDGAASLNLYYKEEGSPLRLVLVEDDVITDCSIKTMDALETLHFSLPSDEVSAKMIVDGPGFKDVMCDLDADSEFVDLLLSPHKPGLIITTRSTAGKCEITLPKEADMIEEFIVNEISESRYKYAQIKPALKTLQVAAKVSLQTGKDGLLCVQFIVKTESNQMAYIEYFCTPVLPEDD